MKIAITGATGGVGSHLIRHLANEGHEVIAFGRKSNPPPTLKTFSQYKQWDLDSVDLPKSLDSDIFIHTAGYVEFWGNYQQMYKTNVEGTLKALRVAQKAKHFIYISTASVYNSFKDKKNVEENTQYPKRYANYYAQTKSEAEQVVIKYSSKFEKVTIVRPHAIYGPGDRILVPRILASIKKNRAFIIGRGENHFSVTHVGNICYGVSLIINSQKKGLTIYNLTDKEPLSINYIYQRLFTALELKIQILHLPYFFAKPLASILETTYHMIKSTKSPLLTADMTRQFTQESTLSLGKITAELKYNPPYVDEDGFRDLKIWIDSIGGIKQYMENPNDCWGGKLITY